MVTSLINGITKHSFGGGNHIYYFSMAIVNVSGDEIQYLYFNNEVPFRFNYSDLTNVYGTTTAEDFVDYLANNDYFVSPTSSTGSGSNVTIVGNTTDFSTGAKQDEQAAILSTIDTELNTQTLYDDQVLNTLTTISEQNKEIIFYLKAIAE